MAKTLKELYGLREMSVEVPDEDLPALRKVIKQATQLGILPADANAWVPKKSKYVAQPTDDEPAPTAAEPTKKQAKGKGKKVKEPEAPARQPIPTDPAVKADLDKSQSAWDSLNQKVSEPSPFKSNVKSEPMKGPEFDPTGIHPDYDMPQFDAPKSANVKLNKQGQPMKEPEAGSPDFSAMPKKKSRLANFFKKKGPEFTDNPYEVEPSKPAAKGAAPDVSKFLGEPEEQEPGSAGQDAMDDLHGFLGKNPAQPKRSAGNDAMGDLDFALHGKTKRRK